MYMEITMKPTMTPTSTIITGCGEEQEATQAGGTGAQGTPTRTEAADRPPAIPEGVATQYRTIEEEVGAEGGEQIKGPWQVSYIVEPAEGWFERRGGGFRFREPAEGETHHLEIIPREASTGRVVPNVPVTLEVLDEQGERVDEKRLSPYYAEFFHYADNFSLPEAGEHALRARVEAPNLRRHGEESEGPRLSEGVEVEFDGVRIDPEEE